MELLEDFPTFSTFRDPAGSVEIRPDGVYRQVRAPHHEEILDFLDSPLAVKLVAQGRLIASEVVSPHSIDQPLVLRHPRIEFPSYPWEWAPQMWLSAAEATLALCRELVSAGWILKDATPLNVLFDGTQPVFVDLLSITRCNLHEPVWYAYGQFVRTFLLPMLAYSRLGWPLPSSLLKRDGYEPEELFEVLPWSARLRQPALSAVTLPRLMSKRGKGGGNAQYSSRFMHDPEIVRAVIDKMLSVLERRMLAATPAASSSAWTAYVQTATHYDDADRSAKQDFVRAVLNQSRPARVLDVGCNSGAFSHIAEEAGADVVSIDTDLRTVDQFCANLKGSGKRIQPLCVDLARPTPAVGWENRENLSFLDRCSGKFDMVMMLAVVHHLLVGSQIPLGHIADLCKTLTTRGLVIEWVPPSDPKFREISRGRDALYEDVTEDAFRSAFGRHFKVERETALTNGRILFHLEKP